MEPCYCMWKIVALQWLVGICLSAGLFAISSAHALSAFWGMVAVALPSSVFALRLSIGARSAEQAGEGTQGTQGSQGSPADVAVFLVGEILKIVATVLLLALVAKWFAQLVWWALLLSVVLTIKSYFLIFLVK